MGSWSQNATRLERQTFFACLSGWSLNAFDIQLYSLVIPALIANGYVSNVEAGMVSSVTLFMSALGGWLRGALLGFPLGFFTAGIPASMATLFSELYPEDIRGSGVGFCYNAGRIFAAGLPALIGWLSNSMHLGTAIGIDAALSYTLVLVAVLLLPETHGLRFDRMGQHPSLAAGGGARDAVA